MKRRRFLQSAGSALLLAGAAGCGSSPSPYRLLSATEASTLSALCEQIIPSDDTPGASWANVVKFIDRQLVYHYQTHADLYRKSLAHLAAHAVAQHRTDFTALPFASQFAIVSKLEQGTLPVPGWDSGAQKAFFRTVRTHTMQGYYGDPRHGGNRDIVSWRSLGVPYPPLRGRDDYRFPKDPAEPHP